ncbi:BCCT family transporter, partial [Staphylococcus haemolyticus]|uniref:BCCT family transporter n=1 Tax=Staphylococcus haemolyticus TaxID=1283 RepID=UPI000A8EDF5D
LYPLGFILSIITLVVFMIFFVTAADSATYVLGMLSSKGDLNPGSFVKVSWGIVLALFAMIRIYKGGTQAIQKLLVMAALPFSIVMILMIWSLSKSLSIDDRRTSNKFQNIIQYKSSKQYELNK